MNGAAEPFENLDREGAKSAKGGSMLNREQIDNNFRYHPPKDDQQKRYTQIREQAKIVAEVINNNCPESREKSLAMTNLEQAVMWANAAIARNE